MAVNRHIVIDLDAAEYRALRELARQVDRDAHQHARAIVRQAVASFSQQPPAGGAGWSAPAPAAGSRKERPGD